MFETMPSPDLNQNKIKKGGIWKRAATALSLGLALHAADVDANVGKIITNKPVNPEYTQKLSQDKLNEFRKIRGGIETKEGENFSELQKLKINKEVINFIDSSIDFFNKKDKMPDATERMEFYSLLKQWIENYSKRQREDNLTKNVSLEYFYNKDSVDIILIIDRKKINISFDLSPDLEVTSIKDVNFYSVANNLAGTPYARHGFYEIIQVYEQQQNQLSRG